MFSLPVERQFHDFGSLAGVKRYRYQLSPGPWKPQKSNHDIFQYSAITSCPSHHLANPQLPSSTDIDSDPSRLIDIVYLD